MKEAKHKYKGTTVVLIPGPVPLCSGAVTEGRQCDGSDKLPAGASTAGCGEGGGECGDATAHVLPDAALHLERDAAWFQAGTLD